MEKVFVIAEIGINHNGDVGITKKLIDMAKECGCDAVKFQKRTLSTVYTQELLDSPRESPWGTTQRAQKEGLEFKEQDYDEIDAYCRHKNIEWFASAWDVDAHIFLKKYNLKYNKVASAMITHTELLKAIALEGKHTFISTGMSDLKTIDTAFEIFKASKCPFTLLHCVSTYPSDDEECNINAIQTLQKRYQCSVGYSGHERGILPSVLAVAFGASVIERHITLDRTMYGSDQAASLEYKGLHDLVRDIRRLPRLLGTGEKKISERELPIAKKLRYFE